MKISALYHGDTFRESYFVTSVSGLATQLISLCYDTRSRRDSQLFVDIVVLQNCVEILK